MINVNWRDDIKGYDYLSDLDYKEVLNHIRHDLLACAKDCQESDPVMSEYSINIALNIQATLDAYSHSPWPRI
jgi:hypothetical protein